MAPPLRDATIVKLGGSLASHPDLRAWLAALVACNGRAIVVPGGGPFADAVRAAQPAIGFDDKAAHHMALLAMEQFGLALTCLEPDLYPILRLEDVNAITRAARTPIFMPAHEAMHAAYDLPASWDLTSDSLAAWLAGKLGVRRVLFVKHGAPFGEPPDLDALAARGIVDPLCAGYLANAGAEAVFLGPGDHAKAHAAIFRRQARRLALVARP